MSMQVAHFCGFSLSAFSTSPHVNVAAYHVRCPASQAKAVPEAKLAQYCCCSKSAPGWAPLVLLPGQVEMKPW